MAVPRGFAKWAECSASEETEIHTGRGFRPYRAERQRHKSSAFAGTKPDTTRSAGSSAQNEASRRRTASPASFGFFLQGNCGCARFKLHVDRHDACARRTGVPIYIFGGK